MSEIVVDSSKALYKQLADIFIGNIRSGIWPVESKILSEKEICEKYKVSRITARRTIDELAKDGFVEKVQGKGTYVKERRIEQKLRNVYRFRDELLKKGIETIVEMKCFEIVSADDELAASLGIEAQKDVFKIERIFISEDKPYAKEISYIPYILCPDLSEIQIIEKGLYKTLNSFNICPDRAVEQLRIAQMTQEISKELKRKKGDAYVEFKRTTYCDGVVVEYAISNVCGDMFVYTVELN